MTDRVGAAVLLLLASFITWGCHAQDRKLRRAADEDPQAHAHPWCTRTSPERRPAFILTPDSLGPLKVSLSKAELHHVCPGLRDTTLEGAEGIPQLATTGVHSHTRQSRSP